MHCRSDEYLADELMMEYKGTGAGKAEQERMSNSN